MSDTYGLIVLIGALALLAWATYGQLMKDPGAPLTDKLAMINQAVAAAEQTIRGPGRGAARLEHALDLIGKWYPEMEVDDARVHVEAAVYWLNRHHGVIIDPGGDSGDSDDGDDGGLDALQNWRGIVN